MVIFLTEVENYGIMGEVEQKYRREVVRVRYRQEDGAFLLSVGELCDLALKKGDLEPEPDCLKHGIKHDIPCLVPVFQASGKTGG